MTPIVARITFHETTRGRKEVVIKHPSEIRVISNFRQLTDTAEIVLPRRLFDINTKFVRNLFKVGDPVTIEMGYIRDYSVEFQGYITQVSDDIPIRLRLQDEMWKLKQIPVNISLPNTRMRAFLNKILPDYEIVVDDFEIGPVRYANYTVAKVLEEIQSHFGMFAYFKNKKLVVGQYYADDTDVPIIPIHLEEDVVINNTQYHHEDDIRIEVKAVSTLSNGEKIDVTIGDVGGEPRQLTYYNIKDRETLLKLAEADYKRYKKDHYNGDITCFGFPVVHHGSKVNLISRLYPERNGTYYVDATDVGIYQNAQFRRTLILGNKVI